MSAFSTYFAGGHLIFVFTSGRVSVFFFYFPIYLLSLKYMYNKRYW